MKSLCDRFGYTQKNKAPYSALFWTKWILQREIYWTVRK